MAAPGAPGSAVVSSTEVGGDGLQFFVDAMMPEHRANPYPLYAARRSAGHMQLLSPEMWLVLGHEEVAACLRHPDTSMDDRRASGEVQWSDAAEDAEDLISLPSMLSMDPPDHTRLRGLVASAFGARAVATIRRRTETLVDGLLEDVARIGKDGSTVDLIEQFAYPLAFKTICSVLGVPPEDEPRFVEWTRVLVYSVDPPVLRSPEQDQAIKDAEAELTHHCRALIERHQPGQATGVIGELLDVQHAGGPITPEELTGLIALLLVAGHDTTVNLIGNGVAGLLSQREQWERLVIDRSLAASATDELLRYDSPSQMNHRIAAGALSIGGMDVNAGADMILVLGAANRDPLAFPDPDAIDVGRDAHHHVAFGGGIHRCIGAALAKMEGELALGGLAGAFPNMSMAGAIEHRPTFTLRGLSSLPVSVA